MYTTYCRMKYVYISSLYWKWGQNDLTFRLARSLSYASVFDETVKHVNFRPFLKTRPDLFPLKLTTKKEKQSSTTKCSSFFNIKTISNNKSLQFPMVVKKRFTYYG